MFEFVQERRGEGTWCDETRMPAAGRLGTDSSLKCAARLHALDMAVNDYFGHESRDGRAPSDRAADSGFSGELVAENIAVGQSDPSVALDGLLGSGLGHCETIMDARLTLIGLGLAWSEDSEFGYYWVQVFGGQE